MPRTLDAYSPNKEKVITADDREAKPAVAECSSLKSSMNSGARSLQDELQETVTGIGVVMPLKI